MWMLDSLGKDFSCKPAVLTPASDHLAISTSRVVAEVIRRSQGGGGKPASCQIPPAPHITQAHSSMPCIHGRICCFICPSVQCARS